MVKLINTKREIFSTQRKTTLYQNLLLIELRYMEVLLYFFKKKFWQNFEGIVITAGNFIISSDSPGNCGHIFCNFSIMAISGIFGKFLTFYYNFILFFCSLLQTCWIKYPQNLKYSKFIKFKIQF